MASKRLLQDSATIFLPTGENDDGSMQYDVYLFRNIFCRASTGKKKAENGYASSDSITIYIFDHGSTVSEGGANKDIAVTCEAIFAVIRDGYQPSADNGEPLYVVPYDASELAKPPYKSRRISKIYRRSAGTPRMKHWEVHAM